MTSSDDFPSPTGFEALADAPRPGRPPRWTREDLNALEEVLDVSAAAGRTWTLPALAEWLRRKRGVDLDSSWLSVLLHRDGFPPLCGRRPADPGLRPHRDTGGGRPPAREGRPPPVGQWDPVSPSATSTIMSSWPPTRPRLPTSTRMVRTSTP
ncbi:helix-turn-helix domain-containing protein [Streptomyces sp. NPDC005507]|uniref:helix-turn-helix domain-containing protein n=1 Tax=unclassified Streptomyces TaxID=2593676 RepID=UPI00339F1BFB